METDLGIDLQSAVAQRIEEQTKRRCTGLDELIKTTKFTKNEIRTMYRGFKQECPEGSVNEETFKEIYEKFFPLGNATSYAHHVFKAFDVNTTGAISFRDLLMSLSTLLHGTLYEKLVWTFRVYDLDGDGVITKRELGNVMVGVYELMGLVMKTQKNTKTLEGDTDYFPKRRDSIVLDIQGIMSTQPEMEIDVEVVKKNIDTVFNKLDNNMDGFVTREEFVEACIQDSTIAESLQNFQFQL